ncbi:anthranilate synthase component II [Falsiporphyromonas endometrii]|uniref:Anthranilate synthase component II n=1 Tax=Falsiporphyromonas endometrii TaxID=1387297 RepID=A0ABV9KB54_9PORP
MKNILFIDNHDSFVYNIVELCREVLDYPLEIVSVDDVHMLMSQLHEYAGIIISPGPGLPQDRPILKEVIRASANDKCPIPLLGVCLGHQAIAQYFGAELYHLDAPKHGHLSHLEIMPSRFLKDVSAEDCIGRYHSWAVSQNHFPKDLCITALSADDWVIMAFEHCSLPIVGVQFHPESIISTCGKKIVLNWSKSLNN